MKPSNLWRGLPGHPIHPPLTDATIGTYTFATVAGLAEVTGITQNAGAYGWWIALIFGLIVTVPTALAGCQDWHGVARPSATAKTNKPRASMPAARLFLAVGQSAIGARCATRPKGRERAPGQASAGRESPRRGARRP